MSDGTNDVSAERNTSDVSNLAANNACYKIVFAGHNDVRTSAANNHNKRLGAFCMALNMPANYLALTSTSTKR